MTNNLVVKKDDCGVFTIPCTIGACIFGKALSNLSTSINLISLSIIKEFGLDTLLPTTMRLFMADRSIKRPIRILYYIVVKANKFILPSKFVILDYEMDVDASIILGRPFLAIGRALVDVEGGDLKFRVNNKKVVFNLCKSMKQSKDLQVVSVVDLLWNS